MSEHSLPEELERWPTDPYALFGVDTSDDERTVKLAYTQLIRRYKPEHYPDHFRRLREAYDTVRTQMQWRWMTERQENDDSEVTATNDVSPSAEPTPSRTSRAELARELPESAAPEQPTHTSPATPTVISRSDELDSAWKLAADGDLPAAYSRLQALRRRFGPQRDIALREYWLLRIDPQIDVNREPLEALAQAAELDRLSGPAVELYRRECGRTPAEAIGQRLSSLLVRAADTNPAALADLLHWRWQAAGRLDRWRVISDDAERFRRAIAGDDEHNWARLLLAALDQLAWSLDGRAHDCFKKLLREVNNLAHVHFNLSRELDRLDLLVVVADGWHKIRRSTTIHPEIATVISRSWAQGVNEYRQPCAAVVQALVADPLRGLEMLDEVCRTDPALVVQLESAIDRYRYQCGRDVDDNDFDRELAQQRLSRRIRALPWVNYPALRKKLLAVCLQEGISPASMIQLLDEDPQCQSIANGEYLAPNVMGDASLRCAFSAWQAFLA